MKKKDDVKVQGATAVVVGVEVEEEREMQECLYMDS
jgi:hypothetical protein